jgi:aminoglycoside 3'-phosphotransferase-2
MDSDGRHWLLTQALPGDDMAAASTTPVDVRIRELAAALRRLHAIDATQCPFNHSAALRLRDAEANLRAGRVDATWEHRSRSPSAALDALSASVPENEELVVTHGDSYLANVVIEGTQFTGFVDCGRLGVADRWQDLALALNSLHWDIGPEHQEAFLAAYGIDVDPGKIAWYQLLDEFF